MTNLRLSFASKWLPPLLLLLASLTQTGCMLDTRSQVREQDEKTVMRKQVQNLQQTTADVNTRFQDLEDDVRKTNGRIEALETRLQRADNVSQSNAVKLNQATDARLSDADKAYREEFAKMRAELSDLKAQFSSAGEQRRSSDASAAASAAVSKADPFKAGEEKYEKKEYREAVLDYERYRKAYPKGKLFSTATYKIGSSFQEMGMADEARAFYEEVLSKFPKSKDAGRANAKLKALKKK